MRALVFTLLTLGISLPLFSQTIGLTLGPSGGATTFSEGIEYDPWLVAISLTRPLNRKRTTPWFLLAEPQFNWWDGAPETTYEAGLSLGLGYRRGGRRWGWYARGSLGPHYLELETRRQTPGLIFSDNLAVGLGYRFGKYRLRLEYRFRHLSNADIWLPNGGINNHFLLFGINLIRGNRATSSD